MEISRSIAVPKDLWDIEDPFSKELLGLWKSRSLEGVIFTLRHKEEALGYVLLEQEGPIATIRGFFVNSKVRGKGLGTELLREVIDYCNSHGRETVLVNITHGAEKIYEKEGFQILGQRKDFKDQWIAFRGKLEGDLKSKLEKKIYGRSK